MRKLNKTGLVTNDGFDYYKWHRQSDRLQNSPYIFAYSSTREQPNKRSAARLKTESETRKTLRLRFTDFEKKPTVLQSDKVKELLDRKLSRSFREGRRTGEEEFEKKK